jgi:hypothetical protein
MTTRRHGMFNKDGNTRKNATAVSYRRYGTTDPAVLAVATEKGMTVKQAVTYMNGMSYRNAYNANKKAAMVALATSAMADAVTAFIAGQ